MRQSDGIQAIEELAYGRFYLNSGRIDLEDDMREKKSMSKILKPILAEKITAYLQKHLK